MSGRCSTIVSFHAHPDDEALLTAGTLAKAARAGHRVVIVMATDGEAGLASSAHAGRLGSVRADELARSAAAIGAQRVVRLGYPDSGSEGTPPASAFSRQDPQRVALELAEILRDERADVLTSYDAAGGYGHPDHVQVHRVARLAAGYARTPVLLEATVDRDRLLRAVGWLRRLGHVLPLPRIPDLTWSYSPAAQITHCVDVREVLDVKRACLEAHASQASDEVGGRTVGLLLSLPPWLQARVIGREWFVEVGRRPEGRVLTDVLASV